MRVIESQRDCRAGITSCSATGRKCIVYSLTQGKKREVEKEGAVVAVPSVLGARRKGRERPQMVRSPSQEEGGGRKGKDV